MIKGKRILIIAPARGGSKGVKLKNIRRLGGIPLIALVGRVVHNMDFVDRAIVSTDHPEIASIAKESGLDSPFYRPEALSGDNIGDIDVLTHALNEVEKLDNVKYDIIIMLQPTSPFRTAKHVSDAVQLLVDSDADSVWTLSLSDSKAHPYKQLIINESGIDYYAKEGAYIIARQQLFPTYHKNGIAYVMTRDCILNQRSIHGKKCLPLLIDEFVANIDTEMDLAFAEFLISNNKGFNTGL